MRRFIGVGAGILLLLATLAAPAAAAGPLHGGPILGRGGISFEATLFPAGALCKDVAVTWAEDGSRMYTLTFPVQRNGDQHELMAGPQWSTVSTVRNDGTVFSMVVGGSLVMDWISHKDGTADAWVAGTVVAGYGPSDKAPMGLWVLNGRVHDTVGTNSWTTTAHSFTGTKVDLCKALAP
jgi:hypothetical protein